MSHLGALTIETGLQSFPQKFFPQLIIHVMGSKHYTMKAVRIYFFQKDNKIANIVTTFFQKSFSTIIFRIPFQIFLHIEHSPTSIL